MFSNSARDIRTHENLNLLNLYMFSLYDAIQKVEADVCSFLARCVAKHRQMK